MLGVDGIQKIYGSKNNLVPPAIITLIRNVGLTFCQSVSIVKVCIFMMKLMVNHVYIIYNNYCSYFIFKQKLLSDKASGLPI